MKLQGVKFTGFEGIVQSLHVTCDILRHSPYAILDTHIHAQKQSCLKGLKPAVTDLASGMNIEASMS